MSATIKFSNGDTPIQRDSVTEAIDYVEAAYPGCYCDGPDCRVLCWESEEIGRDDDGAKAFAEIVS